MAQRELGRFNQGLSSFLFFVLPPEKLAKFSARNRQANDSYATQNALNHCGDFPELPHDLGNGKFCVARWNGSLRRWWSTRRASRPAYEPCVRVAHVPAATMPR